jgi:hypothetical protein
MLPGRLGLALVLLVASVPAPVTPPSAAGPLAEGAAPFGYTWNTVPLQWIDASGGSPAGAAGDDAVSQPLDLGFSFPFYENRYDQVYVSTNGLLTFGRPSPAPANTPLPQTGAPNNLIAVLWDDLAVGAPHNAGRITWLAGGSDSQPYVVVQWQAVTRLSGVPAPPLTFQAILHANGDIVLQYLDLAGQLESATAGIEDETGTDGSQVVHNAPGLAAGLAVRIARPAPAARVKIHPAAYGSFAGPSGPARFDISLRNAGDLAPDTFDLTLAAAWPISLVAPGTAAPLSDTDSDGLPDTGPLAPGQRYTLTVLAQPPPAAPVGAFDIVSLTVASSLAPGVGQTVRLEAARPAPLAQVVQDGSAGAVQFVALSPPAGTLATTLSRGGLDPAIATAANGTFLLAWRTERCNAACSALVSELEYGLLDHAGMALAPVARLTDHLTATTAVLDLAPALAGASSGQLGVAWRRVEYSDSTHSRENIYLAVLDASGALLAPPLNLTQHVTFGLPGAPGVPRLGAPRLAATRDQHFVLAWDQEVAVTGGTETRIFFASTSSTGAVVGPPMPLAAGTVAGPAVTGPTVAAFDDSQAVLAYNAGGALALAVVNSSGSVAQPGTVLGVAGVRPDAVPMPTGGVLLAWSSAGGPQAGVLGGAPLALASGPVTLSHPQATGGENYVSVTADEAGHGILTWIDTAAADFNLYYALLDPGGSVLTPPMILRRGLAGVDTNRAGYANTNYPPSGLRRLWLSVVHR